MQGIMRHFVGFVLVYWLAMKALKKIIRIKEGIDRSTSSKRTNSSQPKNPFVFKVGDNLTHLILTLWVMKSPVTLVA